MISCLIRRQISRSVASCAAAMFFALAGGAPAQVLVVLSDESAGYQEVVQEFRDRLANISVRVRVDVIPAQRFAANHASTAGGSYALVVTVGLVAAQSVVQRQNTSSLPIPTLCLLIPRQSFERLAASRTAPRDRRLSALFIDQPLSRQLELIRAVLPDKRRVGVVYGPTSRDLADELRDKAHARKLTLEGAEVKDPSDVYGALQKILPESDVLLALPDPVAVNAGTAYGLLLTSYHAQVPVVGFSEGWVKAGALVSLFSTARQQGRQGAEIASRSLSGESTLPLPQYPKYFTVRINATVAHSLGLHIEDEAAIAAGLARSDDGSETLRPRDGDAPMPQGKP